MPELPEVQTVISTLEKQIGCQKITSVNVIYPRIIDNITPEEFADKLAGQRIKRYSRRGKFLLFYLTDYLLIAHLRMEGKFYYYSQPQQPQKHTHLVIDLENGQLHYNDVRKFGRFYLYRLDEEASCLKKLGKEPFDEQLTSEYLKNYCRHNKTAIKSQLLDQSMIAGIGNIYANEICFACQLDPQRPSCYLSNQKWDEVITATRKILAEAIREGGTTIRSYTSSLGVTGLFQQNLYVQSREKEECRVCTSIIEKIRLNGRGTYFCPKCQKRTPVMIALSGSIGSGKSEVCRYIAEKGYKMISCDAVNSELLQKAEVQQKLSELLGCPLDQLNRQYIAQRIFSSMDDRKTVEEYLHGQIWKEIERWYQQNQDEEFLFVEVPLLFETGWDYRFDYNVVIYASEEQIYQRLTTQRRMSVREIAQRLSQQLPAEEKKQRADYVIENLKSLKSLHENTEKFLKSLK